MRRRIVTSLVLAIFTGLPLSAHADNTLWVDEFIGGTPGDQPPGWYDATDGIGNDAEIAYSALPAMADVTVTNGSGWGKVVSFSQDVDLNQFDKAEIVIAALSGCTMRVGIFHPGPTPPYQFWDLLQSGPSIGAPGTYVFDIPAVTGETGTQYYAIQLSVEGLNGAVAMVDSVRIYGPDTTPTHTPTVTQTPISPDTPTFTPTPITPGNQPPVANDIFVDAIENTAATVYFSGTDPNLDRLTYQVVTEPQHGILEHDHLDTTLLGSCSTGWVYDVAVASNYAYSAEGSNGIRVIDVSNPANPVQVALADTSGGLPGYGQYGLGAMGVKIIGARMYVADYWSGFRIFDVSSPSAPVEIGHFIPTGYDYDVFVKDQYAYLACRDAGLRVVDISDPANPVEVAAVGTGDWAWDVTVSGDCAYVGSGRSGLVIVNVADPLHPYTVGQRPLTYARGVEVAGNYAYVADQNYMRVIDVSNPASPIEVGSNTAVAAYHVRVRSNRAYVACDSAKVIKIVDVSNPTLPRDLGACNTSGRVYGVFATDNYVYSGSLGSFEVFWPNQQSAIYHPNPQYAGPDAFTYRAYDGVLYSNVANAFIYVNAVTPTPTFTPIPTPIPALILWNKLGSADEVLNSAAGPNLAFYDGDGYGYIGQPAYVPAVFGNGLTLGEGPGYRIGYSFCNLEWNHLNDYLSSEQGTIEVWYLQTADAVANSYGIYRIFDGSWGLDSGIAFESYGAMPGSGHARLLFGLGFGGTSVYARSLADGMEGVEIYNYTNQWIHLAGVWDRNGIAGSTDTLRLYLNGVIVGKAGENNWGTVVGEQADIGGGNDGGIAGKFVLDNLRVWNFAKTDFSDRFVEAPQQPTATYTYTCTPTYTISPTFSPSLTVSTTPTETPTPYVPVAGDSVWEDHFVGPAGNKPPMWWDETNDNTFDAEIAYSAASSYARIVRTPESTWGKVLSDSIVCDVDTYNIVEIGIAEVSSNTTWKLGIQEKEGTWRYKNMNPSGNSEPGVYSFDYQALTGWGWNGLHTFSVTIVVEGDPGKYVVVDFVKVRKVYQGYTPTPTPVTSGLMSAASPVILGHFMMAFGNPNVYAAPDDNRWHGWNENGHDPDTFVAPGKRDIASVYYPYFPNPDPNATPDFSPDGSWDTTDPALIEAHRNELIYADMDGGTYDLQSYYRIDGSGNLLPGVESWHVEAMRRYLRQFKDETRRPLYALPVYEDKTQWKWVTSHADRVATVLAAQADMTKWLELFLAPAYDGVQYKINGRPVVYMFSYEENFGARGYGRLSAQELKDWKEAWAASHGGVAPILVTNIRQTAHPAELEGGSVKYKDVFEGFFDWPVIKGPANGPYNLYNDFALEKTIWEGQDINARYKVLNGEYSFVGSGAWPGFDDGGVMGWGAGIRRGIPRKEGDEYLYPYHLNRAKANGYPVIQIASWNDWFEGTNIEPAVEFSYDYLGFTGGAVRGMKLFGLSVGKARGSSLFSPLANAIMAASMSFNSPRDALFRYLDMTRDGVAAIRNKTPNTGNWWVPYWIYLIRHDMASDPAAQAAADAANAAIGTGDFAQAEAVLAPYIPALNATHTPTVTETSTHMPTETLTEITTPTPTETPTATSTPAAVPQPVFWNRLGSDDEVEHSEIGPNLTIQRSTYDIQYIPGKFGNAVKFGNTYGQGTVLSAPSSIINKEQGCVEMWVQSPKDVVSGVIQDMPPEDWTAFYCTYWAGGSYAAGINYYFGYGATQTSSNCTYIFGGSSVDIHDASTSYSAGDWIHVAYVWDIHKTLAGTKSMALYVNGVLAASSDADLMVTEPWRDIFTLGGDIINSQNFRNGAMDNIKIWNYPKTDFSDRFNESPFETPSPTATLTPTETAQPTSTETPTFTPTSNPTAVYQWTQEDGNLQEHGENCNDPNVAMAESGIPHVAYWEQWHQNPAQYAAAAFLKGFDGINWLQIGGAISANQYSYQGDVAFLHDMPYVAYVEPTSSQMILNVFVKHFNGTGWAQDGGSLNNNSSLNAYYPSVAAAPSGMVYVAWAELVGFRDYRIYVKQWSGSEWMSLGSELNVTPGYSAGSQRIAISASGVPYVVWSESNGSASQVYVKHWTGSAWESNGGSLNMDANQNSGGCDIRIIGETPYAAWDEAGQVHVKYWDGLNWQTMGGSLNLDPAQTAASPRMCVSGNGTLYITWIESNGTSYQVYVKHWDANNWIQDGQSLNIYPAYEYNASHPSITAFENTVYVSWKEAGYGTQRIYVKRLGPETYPTPTPSPTLTVTFTITPTSTMTLTYTCTETATEIPTDTCTATSTETCTDTPTMTPTFTNTPEDTATATLTMTETDTLTPTLTATETATMTSTFTLTPSATLTCTPTASPTPLSPQKITTWPEDGYIMHPNQSQGILAISKYQHEPQPNIRVHYQVLIGSGRFGGAQETYALTGPNAEAARAAFHTSSQQLDLNIIQVDNLGLGARKYIVIIVLPGMIKGASVGDGGTFERLEMVFDTEEEALAEGKTLMAAMVEMIPSDTPTQTTTPTPANSATRTPTATLTPTLTSAPWMERGRVMAYPNPARGKVNFAYTASGAVKVEIDVYRLTGERVAHIAENRNGGVGQTLTTTWEAAGVAPGIYLCRIKITDSAGKVTLDQKKKVALIR